MDASTNSNMMIDGEEKQVNNKQASLSSEQQQNQQQQQQPEPISVQACLNHLVNHLETHYQSPQEPAAAFVHPIHQTNIDQSRKLFQASINALRSTMAQARSDTQPITQRRLALLREYSQNEAANLNIRRLGRLAQSLPSGQYPSSTRLPDLVPANLDSNLSLGQVVLKIIESMGRKLGLEVFNDDTEGTEEYALTMAGHFIVLDFSVNKVSGNLSKSAFTFGSEDSHADVDQLLKDTLNMIDWSTILVYSSSSSSSSFDNDKLDQCVHLLLNFNKYIRSLLDLDITNESQRNSVSSSLQQCDQLCKKFAQDFENERLQYSQDAQKCLSQGHGIVKSFAIQPFAAVIYHLTIQQQQEQHISSIEDILDRQTSLDHVYDIQISPHKAKSNTNNVTFYAHLRKPLVLTRSNAKALLSILQGPTSNNTATSNNGDITSTQHFGMKDEVDNRHVWIEDLLLGENNLDESDSVFDAQMDGYIYRYKIATSKQIPGFMLSWFSFTSLEQLSKAHEIIRDQAIFNELVSNIFLPSYKKPRPNENVPLSELHIDSHFLTVSVHLVPDSSGIALSWLNNINEQESKVEHVFISKVDVKRLDEHALKVLESSRSIPKTLHAQLHSLTPT